MFPFTPLRLALFIGFACFLIGCTEGRKGDKAEVLGKVTLDGTPVVDAQIRFMPKENTDLGTAFSRTNAQGEFIIKPDANNNNWLKPGKYIVLISKIAPIEVKAMGAPEVNLLPSQYSSQEKTPLNAELKNGENKLPPFELVDKKK
ncbi:MAG: hypothetical protein WCN64_10075 [Planctomycetota bacterium]|jgi:hypothetical protein